jgi:ATP-dependent Clp protease protease subunit
MTGNIYISGQIGTYDNVPGVELIDIIGQVMKQPGATEFNVLINSEGGLVDVGFDIYDYLKSLGKPITTIGSGIVASIATVIFMAGDKRQVRENTPFMIHLPWGGSMGTADDLEQFADQLRAIEKKMISFYKSALNMEESAIVPLLKNETWLSPEQLSTLGFTTTQPFQAVAKTYLKPNINMNGAFTERDKSWLEGLFEKVLGKSKKPDILNKVLQDGTGTSIDFTDLPDDGVIEVGQKATVDGNPADGEYVMPDGFTYVFTAGELTEIKDPEQEVENNAELAAALAEKDRLEQELATTKADLATANTALATMKTNVTDLKKQIFSKFPIDVKKAKASKKDDEPADRTAGLREYLTEKRKR